METLNEYLSTINAQTIRTLLSEQPPDFSARVLDETNCEYVMSIQPFEPYPAPSYRTSISYYADILVGFYTESDVSFDITVDNDYKNVYTHTLKANEFAFALDGTVIPFIVTNWSAIYIHSKTPFYCVWAFLNKKIRREVIKHSFQYSKNDSYYSFVHGVFRKTTTDHEKEELINKYVECTYIDLIDFSIFDYPKLAKKRNALLMEELMEVTWHPKRMRQWCLEYDDPFVYL